MLLVFQLVAPLLRRSGGWLGAWVALPLMFVVVGRSETFLAEGYAIRVWQTADGLPQNLVTSAVQTRDGYLWFGTQSGLARFDGERFEVFNPVNSPGLQDRRVSRLFEDAQGSLWIGHEAGGISRYRDGRFESVVSPSGEENEKVIGLGSDEQGRLWAMRESGAVDSLDDGERFPSLIPRERPGVMNWSRGANGAIWLAENYTIARLANGKLVPVVLEPPRYDNLVSALAATADGGVWAPNDNRIRKWKDGRWTEDRGESPWEPGTLSCALELSDGTLAVGTIRSGLYLIFSDGRRPARFHSGNGLPQDWVRFLFEDREGNLWAGAGSSGLVSIHPTAFSVLDAPDQWQGCAVLSVAPGRGDGLWIGSDGAGLYHHSAGQWRRYGDVEGLGNQYIPAVTVSPEGEVWAGNYWWGGPYRLDDSSGRFVRPESVEETSSPVLALVATPETGELLVGSRDGLLKLNGGRSKWLIKSPQGTADDVGAVVRDGEGVIWCGFAQGGLARLANGEVTIFRQEDGLASDSVQCLMADADGSLWIGTADHGLTRYKDGRFTNLTMEQGLLDDSICYILQDDLGFVWLSTRHGLQRLAKEELNRCADGEIPSVAGQIYDDNDGLPVIEFLGGRQAAACKTSDGRLWFASSKGVVSVDPAKIVPNPLPPPVVAQSLWVDGEKMPVISGGLPDALAPDHERLEFQYAALSYVAPSKVRFKYRLDGLDKNWIEVGSKRAAFYSHLPAGSYRFRVMASNNDGVWNMQGASLAFSVAPYFWQTWWFVGTCLLAALALAALSARYFTRRRMKQQMEELERERAVESERSRIAQDIHDDVGASLSRIAMLSQPVRSHLAEPERAATVLTGIYRTANDATRALDEIVWAVDPRHDTLDSLVDYMGKYAQEVLSASNVRCRLDLPVSVPAWPLTADVRHNLFLAFKEALNNTVKHASPSEGRISLELRPDCFVLVVKDDGRGFEIGDSPSREAGRISSGNGLKNIRQRLGRIGGHCEVVSEKGVGTSVSFTVKVAGNLSSSAPKPASRTKQLV